MATGFDPLHLAGVFGISEHTAIRYAVNARQLSGSAHQFPGVPSIHAPTGTPVATPAGARDADAMARSTVKFFKPDKGYGAIASADLPDGLDAWVHFSVIEMDGYRVLNAGEEVEFDYELAQQDSFRFVVTRVRKV